MAESLKEEARKFARQQQLLYGDIIVTNRSDQASPPLERTPQQQSTSLVGQQLDVINEGWADASSLDSLNQLICGCQKCPLGGYRNKFVFGTGNPNADIVVVGEAPGADEDASGEPFTGAAGQLLTKILGAVQLQREDVYILNIIKCRPPGNRTPERFETEQCFPYLLKQLDLIRPRFILALGLTAANTLLDRKAKMGELRGAVHDFYGMKVVVTYHPAALLRNPQWKRPTWEDVQMLRRLADEANASS